MHITQPRLAPAVDRGNYRRAVESRAALRQRQSLGQTAGRPLRQALTTGVCLVALSAPQWAAAQSAAGTWADLEALFQPLGLSITASDRADVAGGTEASGVRIFLTEDPEALLITMDDLRVEPRGERLALIPAETFQVTTELMGDPARTFEITHNGELVGMLNDQNASLDLDFPSLAASMQPVLSAKGAPMQGRFSMTFDALVASLRASREGAAEIVIDAASVDYDLNYPDPGGNGRIDQAGRVTEPHLAFTGTELDMLSDQDGMLRDAFDAGFSARLEFSTASTDQTSSQTVEGSPLNMVTTGAGSTMLIELVDGRVDISGASDQLSISGNLGPMPGSFSIASAEAAFGMPLVTTPTDQPFRYSISLRDVTVSDQLLALINAGAFAGEPLTLSLDLGAQGRLTQELGEDFVEADVPPIDFSTVALNDLNVTIGANSFTGSGAAALIGGVMGQMGGRPNIEGDFTFDLVGGETLLGRLQAMGIVPPDQVFFARMMLNGLGRPVDGDANHLRSEVTLRPGGEVLVNGAPLPF